MESGVLVIFTQAVLALVKRIAPKTRQASVRQRIQPRIDDDARAVHPTSPIPVGEQVTELVSESVIRHSGDGARAQNARELSDGRRFIRVRDDDLADHTVEGARLER